MHRRWLLISAVLIVSLVAVYVETVLMTVVGETRRALQDLSVQDWPRVIDKGWPPQPEEKLLSHGLFVDCADFGARSPDFADHVGMVYTLSNVRVGWPLRCFSYEHTSVMTIPADRAITQVVNEPPSVWRHGVDIPDWMTRLQSSLDSSMHYRRIPLRPLWPGLITNTLLHVMVFTALLLLPRWLIRARRRAKGACLACGYSLAGIAPGSACPECGAPA